jgi:DNA-binding MarR family transcriptional regulator
MPLCCRLGPTVRCYSDNVLTARESDADVLDAYRLLIADVYELAGTSRATSDRLAAIVGQTAARWHVMSAVSDGPETVPAIAHRLGQARQSVQRVVHDLDEAGLVEMRRNPIHARSPLVALTPAGAATLEQIFVASEQNRSELLERSGVSSARLHAARRTIRALLEAFAEMADDH